MVKDIAGWPTINRLEYYFSDYEVEILKQFRKTKGDPTLDDLWEQFMTAAVLIHGQKVDNKMELANTVNNIATKIIGR